MKTLFNSKPDNQMRKLLYDKIQTAGRKIKADARADGQSLAMKHPSLPLLKGDSLLPYISPIKARCEQLGMEVLHTSQPASHHPNGKIDNDWAQMHHCKLQEELNTIVTRLEMLQRELGTFNPSILSKQIRNSILIGIGLLIGEVVINTQAFQVTGDNLISCLILSLAASGAVCLGAHFAGRKYKDAITRTERWTVIIISFIGIGIFSGVIASLRSLYFKRTGIDVNPLFFTVFNMVFFLMAAVATRYLHPTKDELDANRDAMQKHKEMIELIKQRKSKEQEQMQHVINTKEQIKENIKAQFEAEYALGLVKTLYREAVEEFRMGNMMSRTGIPDCWNETIPDLNIPHITFKSAINKYNDEFTELNNSMFTQPKPQTNENNNKHLLN